ncbi:hypothetical protein D3Z62_14085 [Lachnospiraceae bacterium]|nr:hypothetical protein [Lachnospiraceae bacterium]
MRPVISIGAQDFTYIRSHHYFYIDKTSFIKEWWEYGDAVTLLTRPRRFGKTLNLSMMEAFFSNQIAGRGELFEGLSIWNEEAYRRLQGTWPVLFLSFAGMKGDTYETAREGIVQIIIDIYAKYRFLMDGNALNEQEKEYFDFIKPDMSDAVASMSLHRLAICMNRYYGKKVLIFLDEYDTPLQEAYVYGYWEKLVSFIRSLFNCTFKTNPYMERGLMTGITRISKESIFSDISNLEVVTTTSEKYETAFGFTEEEVAGALEQFGMSGFLEKVRYWYNGFRFGNRRDIYNPWSITKYLDGKKFSTYWMNTSSNKLVGRLIREGTPDIKIAMEDLLAGKEITTMLDEEIVFDQLDESNEAIWSLLLASGYLKVDSIAENEDEEELYQLSLTNFEVKREFRKMIRKWFKNTSVRYNDFIKALLADDIDYMNQYMNQISLQTFSSFDTGRKPSEDAEPERFYHGFVLGLMVDLAGQYRITSNRESGLGRYDVVMEPLDRQGQAVVMEFKVFNPIKEKDLHETVENALQQIEDKKYDTELMARAVAKENIRHYGFAFEGKTILIG